MAHILAVNPGILSATGMPADSVFVATALASFIVTMVMALVARLPFALAPGMGLNAFFVFAVVLGMGTTWQFALTVVFLEGIEFLFLTAFNVREAIINAIPANIKKAISVGIGLFIAFIALLNAGIIVNNDATLVGIGSLGSAPALLAIIGLLITATLHAFKVKGALQIGTTVGAMLGTSTITTYVESAAGVEEGGWTGLTALTAGILFGLAIFFAPVFLLVPAAATAPALILVGLFMMSPVKKILSGVTLPKVCRHFSP